jgi:RNA recognition motif-containing protein
MKLFVGNLPFTVDSQQLQERFEQSGINVESATVITDKMTGRSRGFGFVESPDGNHAIDVMSKVQIDGRTLTINEARPKDERGGGGYGGGGGRRGGGGGYGGGGREGGGREGGGGRDGGRRRERY